ncbi:condensin complex subunit 1 [[Candida] railenensis]|uniref:Condensin complex subunit 1 n=1 Tax=[Candida] railenensis TaxID=45579 RepID=A0A9P0QUR0_9ASCO|nr:condensin complex subunit 1 [[Candida] railenensis]
MDFNLSTYFNSFEAEKDYGSDLSNVESKLESVTETLANNPESIYYNHEIFEEVVDLTQSYKSLEAKFQKQLVYLVTSSFNSINHVCLSTIESGDYTSQVETLKKSLERYGYLMYVLLIFLGKEDYTANSRNSRNSAQSTAAWKANCIQVENCLDAVSNVLKIELNKIFITTPERDLFLDVFIRPIFNLMEIPERMKQAGIKMYMFKNISMAVKFHGQAGSVQNLILQSLTYYLHLPNYMAELLHTLSKSYDYIMLTEEVLREISQIEFNSNDSNGPKSISEFLIKLSELSPRLILKQMSSVALLLDNSNMTLRCSVVETCGNIVVDILKNEVSGEDQTDSEHHSANNGVSQVDGLLELLEERFLDQNPYVRTKAIQALTKLCSLPDKLMSSRQKMIKLSVRSLNDKSTLVRRNSIKLLSKIVLTHPFATIHGTQLSSKVWRNRLEESKSELESMFPQRKKDLQNEDDSNEKDVDDDMDLDTIHEGQEDEDDVEKQNVKMEVDENENEEQIEDDNDKEDNNEDDEENENGVEYESGVDLATLSPEQVNAYYKLQLTIKYYHDALAFIDEIEEGVVVVSQLLFSRNRNEVLESMDFLVLSDAYDIQGSSEGIRKMLHLVWMKGSSDEGKSIAAHLIDCYQSLFLTAPSTNSRVEQAAYIAKNLIELTYSASVADLASLEKLLCLMYDNSLIPDDIIQVLWQIYNFEDSDIETSRRRCRGAIIILGMLALADNGIIIKGLDSLLNVGLSARGSKDPVLAKYTCIAMQRVIPSNSNDTSLRIAREDESVEKLKSTLLKYSENSEWYSIAEQAIGAIYQVSSKPDEVGSEIIREKAKLVFQSEEIDGQSKVISLSQLLFIVGHIAIKTIVYLEKLEGQFKKKKHDSESKKKANDESGAGKVEDEDAGELEMIGGTSEDDFTDAVIYIKERQLLYGEDALLSKFGPLVKEICSNNKIYDNESLQRSATLCLAKLMCVSSKYCEENLPLLITIMEKSPDPIIRCNCVLGLGDMAVCFNNLVDENTDFLYRRLADENIMVQRTCLMTVTFLILAGQVKVKGQLSSMAKCLENPDQGISDMCRLFFTELATKDNAIYNGFIDIFSGLSNDESLSKDSMKRIIKFLVGFIEKEKHQKQLAEKLLVRLNKSQEESQWNDLAYVLNVIPFKNEVISQALEGGYKMVSARQ